MGSTADAEAIGVFDSIKAIFEQKKDRKTGAKSDLRSKVRSDHSSRTPLYIEDLKKIVSVNVSYKIITD